MHTYVTLCHWLSLEWAASWQLSWWRTMCFLLPNFYAKTFGFFYTVACLSSQFISVSEMVNNWNGDWTSLPDFSFLIFSFLFHTFRWLRPQRCFFVCSSEYNSYSRHSFVLCGSQLFWTSLHFFAFALLVSALDRTALPCWRAVWFLAPHLSPLLAIYLGWVHHWSSPRFSLLPSTVFSLVRHSITSFVLQSALQSAFRFSVYILIWWSVGSLF